MFLPIIIILLLIIIIILLLTNIILLLLIIILLILIIILFFFFLSSSFFFLFLSSLFFFLPTFLFFLSSFFLFLSSFSSSSSYHHSSSYSYHHYYTTNYNITLSRSRHSNGAGFGLHSRSGSAQQLAEMIATCRAAGVQAAATFGVGKHGENRRKPPEKWGKMVVFMVGKHGFDMVHLDASGNLNGVEL